jgi:glycosyltransferase involved in cell wall biosynthesis
MGNRILIAGVGPTPQSQAERLHAPGLRLWAMTQILLAEGHHVLMVEAQFGESAQRTEAGAGGEGNPPGEERLAGDGIPITRVDLRWQRATIPLMPDAAARALRTLAHAFHPDALVTSTDVMALAATRSGLPQPLYVDYFGDPMAERQMQAFVHDSDDSLASAWAYMLPALLRADRFSACSVAHRHALLGQLSAAGRLNRHTASADLVDVLPQGYSYERHIEPRGVFALRGTVVPEQAIVILFTGGYNSWLDEKVLFAAVEEAMTRDPAIHYVSTGGDLPGHNTVTFERFQGLLERSQHRGRYHFVGWVPTHCLADICEQCDMAINLDRSSLEAEFGLRNRLYLWMGCGVAVVSTAVSEEIAMFAAKNLIREVPCGDAHSTAEALLELGHSRELREQMSQRARRFITTEYTFERLMRPLASWAKSPSLAPDRLAAMGEKMRNGERTFRPPEDDNIAAAAAAEEGDEKPAEVSNPLANAQRCFSDMATALEAERRARKELEERMAGLEGSRLAKLRKLFFCK